MEVKERSESVSIPRSMYYIKFIDMMVPVEHRTCLGLLKSRGELRQNRPIYTKSTPEYAINTEQRKQKKIQQIYTQNTEAENIAGE